MSTVLAESYCDIKHITPDDGTDGEFTNLGGDKIHARALLIGTAGNIKVTMASGRTLVIPSGVLTAGIFHPIEIRKIWFTGTSASNIYCAFDTRMQ